MYRRSFLLSAGLLGVSAQTRLTQTQSMLTDQIGPWVEIDAAALRFNLEQVHNRSGQALWAVLKNNAYGHGLIEVAKILDEVGPSVRGLAVFKVSAALQLRRAGIGKPILVLGPASDEEFRELVARRIIPTLYTARQRLIKNLAGERQEAVPVHLYLDTGLGRAGLPYRQAAEFLRLWGPDSGVRFGGILTALTEEDDFDLEQIRRLEEVFRLAARDGLDLGQRHAASSAGIFHLPPSSQLDVVRPGIAIYGCYPTDRSEKERSFELRPALSFKTRVMVVKKLEAGDSLQYHRVWKASRATWVATLAAGHHDGWPTATAGTCEVLIRGRRYPVVASVSSNHTLVELGSATDVEPGDEVLLFGKSEGGTIEAHEVAKKISGSVYQLLMHVNPELRRIVV